MALVTKVVSDHTKAALDEYIEVTVERPGYALKIGNDFYAGPHRVHLALDEVAAFFKTLEWVKPPKPEMLSYGLLKAGVEDARQT